jgi:outer membrane protein OmpA-like peptidoglycan-associated protein
MLKRRFAFVLAFALALPFVMPTTVQAGEGFYLGLGAGAVFPEDSDVTGTGVNVSTEFDTGYSVIGALGYAYRNGFRSEFELGYRDVNIDSVSGVTTGSGDVDVFSFMANGYYDFRNKTAWTPYLGLGIGGAKINADAVSPISGSVLDDSDLVFAFQGMAGVTYDINEQLSMFADYRYFRTMDPDFTLQSGTDVDSEYADHRIMVGLRWFFNAPKKPMAKPTPVSEPAPAPKAAPVPAPAPAPKPRVSIPRTFLVFFDWDKADLTKEAQDIVNSAADFAKKGNIVRIVATGHADRSGPDKYNMGLSKRRADSVKAELIRRGISADGIAVLWKGEREPLVATKDGVREPQNRRVEIVLK